MPKKRAPTTFTWTWRCDRCRKGGTLTLPSHIDGWSGATAVLEAHRRRAPRCHGDARTVRVSGQTQRKKLEA
jgi:hypothetical protein